MATAPGTVSSGSKTTTGVVVLPLEANARVGAEGLGGIVTILNPGASTPGVDLPSEQPTDPTLGPGDPGYELTLPRTAPLPPLLPSVVVEAVTLSINGTDYSDCYLSDDWLMQLNGVSSGSVQMREVGGIDLDPSSNTDLQPK